MQFYTETEQREIEKVKSVFEEYILASEYIDLLLSEKIGYILIYINPPTQGLALEPEIITDGRNLCKLILSEIASDVLSLAHNGHSIAEADPLERAEILKRIEPYAEQLPEYHHLVDALFTKSNE
jgi:hypothetical protein